ncbi:MAG: DUF2141 domain-containing protein [Pseudomonadota bacterium]
MPYSSRKTVTTGPHLWLLALFIGLCAPAQAAGGADIQVQLEGWTDAGPVHAALMRADQADWSAAPLHSVQVTGQRLGFVAVAPGRYAVQLFQDRNGNGRLDLSPRGIPLEPVGFSGNPSLLKGKPTLADSAFEHGTAAQVLSIRLRQPRRARGEPTPLQPASAPQH